MSDDKTHKDIYEELATYDIGKLRKYASLQRVAISRDMTQEQILEAIKQKMKDREAVGLAEAGTMPAPGFARIILHRDPTPGSSNRPVYINANGWKACIPRGVEVDVPHKAVNVLNDAKEVRKEEDPSQPYNSPNRWRNTLVHSYPFQLVSMTPGPDPRPGLEKTKMASYGPRVAFRDRFGRWPKRAELLEAIKDGLIKLNSGERVQAKEFSED